MTWAALVLLGIDIFVIAFMLLILSTVMHIRTVPPPLATRKKLLKTIMETLGPLPPGSVFYDLGSGTGQVVCAVAASHTEARCIGIEKHVIPYYLARYNAWRLGLRNATFRRTDILTETYADATHLYTYLYPETMDLILSHLTKQVTTGAVLVSLDFQFTQKVPVSRISLAKDKAGELGETLFVYRF